MDEFGSTYIVGDRLVTVCFLGEMRDSEKNRTNGALIKAAPKLLAACEAQSKLIEAQTQMQADLRLGRRTTEKTWEVIDSRQAIEEQARIATVEAKGE